MSRPEITAKLSSLLEKHIDPYHDPRIYWSKEVTFNYATNNQVPRLCCLNLTISG